MPITKSAIKRMRSNKKKHMRNQHVTTKLNTLFKTFGKSVAAHDLEKAQLQARTVIRENDKAASKGIIPKQRANRKKARIAKTLQKLAAAHSNK